MTDDWLYKLLFVFNLANLWDHLPRDTRFILRTVSQSYREAFKLYGIATPTGNWRCLLWKHLGSQLLPFYQVLHQSYSKLDRRAIWIIANGGPAQEVLENLFSYLQYFRYEMS